MKLGIRGSGALWLWFVLLEHTIALYAEWLIRKLAMFVWCRKQCGQHPQVETERSFFVIKKQYVNAQKPRKVNWGKLGFTSLSYVYGEIKL